MLMWYIFCSPPKSDSLAWRMTVSQCSTMHGDSFRPQSEHRLPPSCCPDNHLLVTTTELMLFLLTGIILPPTIYRLVISVASGAYEQ